MRKLLYAALLCCTLLPASLQAQAICNAAGNLLVYSNYDGGVLNINVDQNIPNLKIGIVTYEPVTINITGAFAGNVTEVRYAGYVSTNNNHCSNSPTTTSITGVSSSITSVNFLPAATSSNPNGYSLIVCNYSCDINTNQGGCNTADQIVHYFQTTMNATLRYHFTQYGCWSSSPYLMSQGGNCCAGGGGGGGCTLVADAGPDAIICPGDSVQLNVSAPGALSYTWTPAAGLSNTSAASTWASPTGTTTYVVEADAGGGCTDLDTVVVTVHPVSTLTLTPVAALCQADAPVSLIATPPGGVWSGNGVSGNTFDPSGITSGSSLLTYTYTEQNGCVSTAGLVVTVHTTPVISLPSLDTLCTADGFYALPAGAPSGGTWAGPGITGNSFNPGIGAGVYALTYTWTSPQGCSATDTTEIVVNTSPIAPGLIQVGADSLHCTDSNAVAYQWFLNGNPCCAGTQSIAPTQSGDYSVQVTWANGCASPVSQNYFFLFVATDAGVVPGFRFAPNPSTGSISVDTDEPVHLCVWAADGRCLYCEDHAAGRSVADLSAVPPGVYLLEVQGSRGSVVRRLVRMD